MVNPSSISSRLQATDPLESAGAQSSDLAQTARCPEPDCPSSLAIAALQQETDGLRAALETRDLIWSAKLVIARSLDCSGDVAFAVLRQQSQHENRKLRDVAAELVALDERRRNPTTGNGG